LHLSKSYSDPKLAEHFFREAIEIAIEDESKSQHLGAATSLAKHRREQGEIDEALP